MDHRGSICRTLAYIGAGMDHTLVIPALRELQTARPVARAAEVRLVDQVGRRPARPSRRGPILIAAALSLVAALAAGVSSAALHAHARATAPAAIAGASTASSVEVDPAALARSGPSAVEPEPAAPPAAATAKKTSVSPTSPASNDARDTATAETAELDDEPSGGLVPAPAHLLEGALRGD